MLVWVGGRQLASSVLFFLVWFGMVGLGLVCTSLLCDHISGADRPYCGNEQIWLTQQHLVLVMIFTKHTHTRIQTILSWLHSVLYRLIHTLSSSFRLSVCVHCYRIYSTPQTNTLSNTLLLSFIPSFSSLWCCSRSKKDTVPHVSQVSSQAPWWSHQSSYSAVHLTHAGVGSADPAVRPVPVDQQAMT